MLSHFKKPLLFKKLISNLNSNIYCFNCLFNDFIINTHFLTHSKLLHTSTIYHSKTNFVTSIPAGVSWTWPPLLVLNKSLGNYQLSSTQSTPSEDFCANELLDHILSKIERSPSLATEISSAYIEELCSQDKLSAAVKLFHLLRDRNIILNANAYNLLLVAAGNSSNVRLTSQIFKEFLVSGEPISKAAYLNLARVFKDINDETLLLGFIKKVSVLTTPRSAAVVNRIIYAFDVCAQTPKALLIYDFMKSLESKPDLITYNTVLGILGRVGRGDEMLCEFAVMKEAKVTPDIVSYNTIINTFRKLGRLDMCCVFLEEVKKRGFELDLRTYTSLIDCFGHCGKIDESLRLFNEMKIKRIRPSIYIYRSLINNAKKLGKTELSLMFTEEMKASIHNLVGPKDFKRKKR